MTKNIEIKNITIDDKIYDIVYIRPDKMYIVTPYIEDENIKEKLLEALNITKGYKIIESEPRKVLGSVSDVKKALLIFKSNQ